MSYDYTNCEIVRVVDGDTLDIRVDVGFRMTTVQRFRLMNYNAPELRGVEGPLGLQAQERLYQLCKPGTVVAVRTYKGDAFGRWLCDVQLNSGPDVVRLLIEGGYGVFWDGRGARPRFDPLGVYPRV